MEYLKEWRFGINTYIHLWASELEKTGVVKVLEVGPENNTSEIISAVFPQVLTLDQRPDLKTDYFLDICNTDSLYQAGLNGSFNAIFCLEVLEHTFYPWIAATNLANMLQPKGYLFISVPSFFGWHPHGNGLYGDYWRFLPGHVPFLFPNLSIKKSQIVSANNTMLGMIYLLQKT